MMEHGLNHHDAVDFVSLDESYSSDIADEFNKLSFEDRRASHDTAHLNGVSKYITEFVCNEVALAYARYQSEMMERVMKVVNDALRIQEQQLIARVNLDIDEKLNTFCREFNINYHCNDFYQHSSVGRFSESAARHRSGGSSPTSPNNLAFSETDLRSMPSFLDEDFGDYVGEHAPELAVLTALPQSTFQHQCPSTSTLIESAPAEQTKLAAKKVRHNELDLDSLKTPSDLDKIQHIVETSEENMNQACTRSERQCLGNTHCWVFSQNELADEFSNPVVVTEDEIETYI